MARAIKKSLRSTTGLAIAMALIQACSAMRSETKSHRAQNGDVLVKRDGVEVVLTQQFQPGSNNGLFDGGVKVVRNGKTLRSAEVNAICSMPDLKNWPQYDNIYGRWLDNDDKPGKPGQPTSWQLLIYFDGNTVNTGKEKAPDWAERLAQNLCRKADFKD